jgi:trans-aconitate methyltransferase
VTQMTQADFEARYREHPDPWGYETSAYEREKYEATLAACGPGPYKSAIELGSSIGVFSALLAPRCRLLVTVDAAPTAVATARRRLAGSPNVTTILGSIPEAIPRRDYDLVVASEILYYLDGPRLEETLDVVRDLTRLGARLVAVHWRPSGPERPFDASQVHARLRAQPWLTSLGGGPDRPGARDYLLDVLERR